MEQLRIKEVRKSKGWTQEDLAHAIGVKRSVISKYESGAISPSLETLQAIANALDGDIVYLISGQTTEEVERGILIDVEAEARDELKKLQSGTENRPYEEKLSLNESIIRIINLLKELNSEGRQKAIENIEIIAGNPHYRYARKSDINN